ncbi:MULTISPECIES: hypothetical protein [Tenacibaculum]|uniref:hypothetical protein n=1 Tax=Tenacibaculum TaxID=104267 RepID=UPI002301B203|nr:MULTISPECIES: hypothetical protein [Tenacibaculum]WCC46204.1 hypothetical protein PJH08_07280 [Tenacibaculum finnmarkense]
MKLKTLTIVFTILITTIINAQVVPKNGKKIIPVKEKHLGEYLQKIKKSLSKETENNFKKIATKKLIKYGFTDITITEVGEVAVPEGWATKMGSLVSNKSLGQSQLETAKTYNEIVNAVNKMYEPEDEDGVDWKFQINFIDNISGNLFKLRVSNFRSPKYIIKESDLVKSMKEEK